jgi:hypothetical protein
LKSVRANLTTAILIITTTILFAVSLYIHTRRSGPMDFVVLYTPLDSSEPVGVGRSSAGLVERFRIFIGRSGQIRVLRNS